MPLNNNKNNEKHVGTNIQRRTIHAHVKIHYDVLFSIHWNLQCWHVVMICNYVIMPFVLSYHNV